MSILAFSRTSITGRKEEAGLHKSEDELFSLVRSHWVKSTCVLYCLVLDNISVPPHTPTSFTFIKSVNEKRNGSDEHELFSFQGMHTALKYLQADLLKIH